MQWYYYVLIVLGVLVVAGLIASQTPWFKVRKYALDCKRIFDKYKLQEKAEAVQAVSQQANVNPVLAKKPLNDLIGAYKGLIGEFEKVKVPEKAQALHSEQMTMFRESLSLYQLAAVGGFRQKSLMDKQKKLAGMEKSIQAKMEGLYGKPKEPKKKK